jgi:integrase
MVKFKCCIEASFKNERSHSMGKDLKRKELGMGLSQQKDGLYVARYTDRFGKRQTKRFKKMQEARKWLADSTYRDESSNPLFPQQMTVDSWFDQWIEMKKVSIRPGTIDTYTARYMKSISPVIGDMKISEVKPLHCQMILNKMNERYHNGTIKQTRIVLHNLFEDARDNDIIQSNPMKRSYKCEGGIPKKEREALTEQELKLFLKGIEGHRFEIQYRFILQTSCRIGELIGIQWSDIDYENRCLYIRRTMSYKYKTHSWRSGSPKSQASRRTIPLTDEAIRLLEMQREKNNNLKVFPKEYAEYVFIDEAGLIKQGSYDAALKKKLCHKCGIKIISVHQLRHTFATRCVMGGMPIKVLQSILGDSSIDVVMNYYVHTTREEVAKELEKVSSALIQSDGTLIGTPALSTSLEKQ